MEAENDNGHWGLVVGNRLREGGLSFDGEGVGSPGEGRFEAVVVSDRAACKGGGNLGPKAQKNRKPCHKGLVWGWIWAGCGHLGSCEVTDTLCMLS